MNGWEEFNVLRDYIKAHARSYKESGDRIVFSCLFHDDATPSASMKIGRSGQPISYCSVCGKIHSKLKKSAGLWHEPHNDKYSPFEKFLYFNKVCEYDYVDFSTGVYLFTRFRMKDKKQQGFPVGIKTGNRVVRGIDGADTSKAVFCNGQLTRLKEAIAKGDLVAYTEGEKDCLGLWKAGFVSFTCGGVRTFKESLLPHLRGGRFVVFGDNDVVGKQDAERITGLLNTVGSATMVIPPDVPEHGDVSDFLESHSREELEQLIEQSTAVTEKPRAGLLDLSQFHLCNENGKITGVFDFGVFQYLKSEHDLFILGGTPYLYDCGAYVADESGARLKTMIRELIYPNFIKSTTIKRIYELFISAAELQATFEDVNQYPPYWINFQNGFYDTKARRMVPHDPKYRAINQIPHEYRSEATPEGGAVETWLQFICPEADDREMLLQFMGLTLTTDVSQQKFLVLCGEGGSGKSTLIRLNEAMTGSRNVSNISLTELQQRFATFGLLGKTLNSCADLEIAALEDTSTLKKVLGEDSLRGEQKGKDAISFKSYAKLIFSTNELPLVKAEKTNGFYRRLLVLPMNKVPEKKNADLFTELVAQIDYFIKLSVEALERMYKAGTITESRASVAAVNQLRCDSDTVQAFITESCSLGSDFRAERVAMYRKYGQFCEDNERQPLKKTAFLKSVRSKGFTEIKSSGEWFFLGISLEKKIPYDSPENSLDGFLNLPKGCQEELPFD